MGMDKKLGWVTLPNDLSSPTHDDPEPIFIIRGKDIAAPLALMYYGRAAEEIGASMELVIDVQTRAKEIRAWQERNSGLVKIPD